MSPEYKRKITQLTAARFQRGLGLPTALFMIVVMILIVAGINQINELTASAYGREWLSVRAFYAAESGAQSAAVQALNVDQTMAVCDENFISNMVINVAGLRNCTVNVTCNALVVSSETFYTFTSSGRCGTGADQATRIVQVRLKL